MRVFPGPLVALLVLSLAACGDDRLIDTSNTVTGPGGGDTTATVRSLQIGGNRDLTIGTPSQLTLTATFSNGSARLVTAESTWMSSAPSVATISAGGVVTPIALGSSTITATFQGSTINTTVNSLAAGTFIFEGRTREPGSGSLAGVRVFNLLSNTSTVSDPNGNFTFLGLPAARFRIDHPGFEPFEYANTPAAGGVRRFFVDAPLQRVVRVARGQSTGRQQIAPNDVAYTVGSDSCNPCKLIRVSNDGSGELILRLTWEGLPGALRLWVNGTRNSSAGSSIAVATQSGGSETLVYIGWMFSSGLGASGYAFFNLSVD